MPAHAHRRVILPPVGRRRKLSFALTPLADAMFQLLVFFMLSSSLQPYSLITLTPGAAQAAPGPAPAPSAAAMPPTIWHLGSGSLRMGTETVPIDRVDSLIRRMRAQGSDALVIFSGAGASVQDVATVLNAVTLGHLGSVQIVSARGG